MGAAKKITEMHDCEIAHRIGVMQVIKSSMEFTGRNLPESDAEKLASYLAERNRRATGITSTVANAR